MKAVAKAPKYTLDDLDCSFRCWHGRRIPTDSTTTKLPKIRRITSKFRDHANSSAIGTVLHPDEAYSFVSSIILRHNGNAESKHHLNAAFLINPP